MKLNVAVRLEPGFEKDDLDEVFISSGDPYINFAIRLPKKLTKELGSGAYELSLVETKKKAKGD